MRQRDCGEAKRLLVDRAYGELDEGDAALLDRHLSCCLACTEYAARVEALARCKGERFDLELTNTLSVEIKRQTVRVLSWQLLSEMFVRPFGWLVALALAFVSWRALTARPVLAAVPRVASAVWFLAWLVLYGTTFEALVSMVTGRSRSRGTRSRAVVYGVLASVVLSVTVLGGFCFLDHLVRGWWSRILVFRLSELVALSTSVALMVVGVFMGIATGRESSFLMSLVLLIFSMIMAPILAHGPSALIKPGDLLFGLLLFMLWGLSGALLGRVLGGTQRPRALA